MKYPNVNKRGFYLSLISFHSYERVRNTQFLDLTQFTQVRWRMRIAKTHDLCESQIP